jgi:hypothetical protein
MSLGNLSRLSRARTISLSAENPRGIKGQGGMAVEGNGAQAARELGQGWKVSPFINIKSGETAVLADIEGAGAIQHIWITLDHKFWRSIILRMYWDGESTPSVEVPIGDFFGMGWCVKGNLNSLPISVNPACGLNSYWEMPFMKSARITLENVNANELVGLYYQITYTQTEVPPDVARFHAQFRRSNPLPYMHDHVLLDGVRGWGHYVGTYIAWQNNNNGWWGEGEIKFFMDGDGKFPSICGTGTEDYFGGAWCFQDPFGIYHTYTTPFLGFHQHIKGDGEEVRGKRFGMYRWHVMDPIRFEQDLRVTIQALGWRSHGRYLPLQDDIASTAFWYQTEPHAAFPALPDANGLEVI